jgi:shikimate dehydrogenase
MAYCPAALGIVGHPVAHSLSPLLHAAALAEYADRNSPRTCSAMPTQYERWDVRADELGMFVKRAGLQRMGGNVTMPHKEVMLRYCAEISDEAQAVGAVNSFACHADGHLVGHNTDIHGAQAALSAVLGSARAVPQVTVLGAGGSAAAVVQALAHIPSTRGATLHVVSRSETRANQRVSRWRGETRVFTLDLFTARAADDTHLREALDGSALVVHCTPLGMHGDVHPCAVSLLPDACRVLDLVYVRGGTAWVRACRARGMVAEDGTRMLVEQAAASFAWWFSAAPPVATMWAALKQAHAES